MVGAPAQVGYTTCIRSLRGPDWPRPWRWSAVDGRPRQPSQDLEVRHGLTLGPSGAGRRMAGMPHPAPLPAALRAGYARFLSDRYPADARRYLELAASG